MANWLGVLVYMRKIHIIGVTLVVLFGGVFLVARSLDVSPDTQKPENEVTRQLKSGTASSSDPTKYDYGDVDYAKKKLIHHQLAVLIAEKAKTDAQRPEVRQFAEQIILQETERANQYKTILTSWDETYMNITDFPETSGCNGYPTFSGMLPHKDVGAYRLSSGENVDVNFFSLLIQHHTKATILAQQEGAKIRYGELVTLRDRSTKQYAEEMSTLAMLQSSLL